MSKMILKPNHEVAMLLTFRAAQTEMGKRVQAAVLARVEIQMAIESEIADLDTDTIELIEEDMVRVA